MTLDNIIPDLSIIHFIMFNPQSISVQASNLTIDSIYTSSTSSPSLGFRQSTPMEIARGHAPNQFTIFPMDSSICSAAKTNFNFYTAQTTSASQFSADSPSSALVSSISDGYMINNSYKTIIKECHPFIYSPPEIKTDSIDMFSYLPDLNLKIVHHLFHQS